jgi:membrane glycosyltransferase
MELDDFKKILNQKLETDHLLRTEDDFAELLKKKANSVITKIRKSLQFEIISCIVITLLFAIIGFTSSYSSFRIYFITFTLLFLPFAFILIYLLRKTNQINNSGSIRSHLQSIISILEEFVKRYFQFTIVLIPICFVFAFILGYSEKEPIPLLDQFHDSYKPSPDMVLTSALLYMVVFTVGMYYFTKWYLRKLYGKYILQLKEYMAELGADE